MSAGTHIVSAKLYVGIFLILIALTGLTTGVAYIDLGSMNTVVALAIALVKTSLVVLFFMHLRHESGLSRMVIIASLLWLAILVSLTLADERTRSWSPVPESWGSSVSRPTGP